MKLSVWGSWWCRTKSLSILSIVASGKDPVAMVRYLFAIVDGVQLNYMLDPKGFPIKKIKEMIIKQFA